MIKIGFVDISLDNWHSNHYPAYLRAAAKKLDMDIDLCYAWGRDDPGEPWKITNRAWCTEKDCVPCESCQELIDRSDVIMVMCADDCKPHEELAMPVLESGKPTYCDKTFAPDVDSAERMFEVAEKHSINI